MVTVKNEEFAEQVRHNQRELAARISSPFDFIVCGAGTSGCVVAARLAADPNLRVLLIEAGGHDETELVRDPNCWPLTLGGEMDWAFAADANPQLNGRALAYSMGKVLGGGSCEWRSESDIGWRRRTAVRRDCCSARRLWDVS